MTITKLPNLKHFFCQSRRKYEALDALLASEEASFSARQVLYEWLINPGTLLTVLALVLFVVALFFINRSVVRVIVEVALVLSIFFVNLILQYSQERQRHLRGVLRIRAKLLQVGRRQPAGADEMTLLRVAKAIIDRERYGRLRNAHFQARGPVTNCSDALFRRPGITGQPLSQISPLICVRASWSWRCRLYSCLCWPSVFG